MISTFRFDAAVGKLGDVTIDDSFFAEILEPFRLESPLSANMLCRVLDKLFNKCASGEIYNDHSLSDEYRVERARDIRAKVIAISGGPKWTMVKGGKERRT